MNVCLLGVDFHSDNLGCGALGYAAINFLKNIYSNELLKVYAVIYDDDDIIIDFADDVVVESLRVRPKQKEFWKALKKFFKNSDVILDFTGGDSFSDIYGFKRFANTSLIKEAAIKSDTKFVMAPQTIGPFDKKLSKIWAKRILRKSDVCFVRDELSEAYTESISGVKPVLTTDVAFALPYKKTEIESEKVRIGINVSSLMWFGTDNFNVSGKIKLDYKKLILNLMEYLTKDEKYDVYLIPHVFDRSLKGNRDDYAVCRILHEKYNNTSIISDFETPQGAKSIIATMDIFIGSRMHATIAAFSSGVATIPISYSRKFEGLYNSLDYEYIISGEKIDTDEAFDKICEWISSYELLKSKVDLSKPIYENKLETFRQKIIEIQGSVE